MKKAYTDLRQGDVLSIKPRAEASEIELKVLNVFRYFIRFEILREGEDPEQKELRRSRYMKLCNGVGILNYGHRGGGRLNHVRFTFNFREGNFVKNTRRG